MSLPGHPFRGSFSRDSAHDRGWGGAPAEVRELIRLALDFLPGMYCPEQGLFCDYQTAEGERFGVSGRYSLICLIGLHRAGQSGYSFSFDLDALYERASRAPLTSASDAGLMLWAGTLLGRKEAPAVYKDLRRMLNGPDLSRMIGMDLGLSLSGLVSYGCRGGGKEVMKSARALVDFILTACVHPRSRLFYHTGGRTFRRNFPNFATHVYLMHGLAQYGAVEADSGAVEVAANCAEALCSLQRSDGGWPWLYRASGGVVEHHEIYSVHQDAMLPMSFLEVGTACANPRRYQDPILKGLRWLYGANELNFNVVDQVTRMVYRSIRRRAPFHRVALGVNTLSSLLLNRPLFGSETFPVEVNRTDRPYHLGWLLYAWCGREELLRSSD